MSRTPGRAVTWSDVYRALQDEETRSSVLGLYIHRGFSQSEFERPKGRRVMADVMVSVEDRLELAGVRGASARERVRGVRRLLERECWP